MSYFTLPRDGAMLRGWDGGEGLPVIFQHGMGGDETAMMDGYGGTLKREAERLMAGRRDGMT